MKIKKYVSNPKKVWEKESTADKKTYFSQIIFRASIENNYTGISQFIVRKWLDYVNL